MLTHRLTYVLAEGSVLVRGIFGSPAPASMWTGWNWRTLHTSLETIARRFGIREVSDDEAERLIAEGPELLIQAGDVAVSWKPGPERSRERQLRALERSLRGADRLRA